MTAYKLSDTEYLVPVADYTAGHVADGYQRIGPDHPDFNAWTPHVVPYPEDEDEGPPLPPKTAPKSPPAAASEQRRLAFVRWENMCLRRLDRGLPLDVEFDTRHLDVDEMEMIRAGLANCTTTAEVQAEFTRAREMGVPRFNETWAEAQRRGIAEGWRARRLTAEREVAG